MTTSDDTEDMTGYALPSRAAELGYDRIKCDVLSGRCGAWASSSNSDSRRGR